MKNQVKTILMPQILKIVYLVIVCSLFLFYIDSGQSRAFAISINHSQRMSSRPEESPLKQSYSVVIDATQKAQSTHRAHAPEPGSIFMVISGIGAAIVRFAQRSFLKFKRLFDITVSIFGLVVSLPILAITAILIKLSSKGPVIYKQARVGKDGQNFNIYKLRTMVMNAEDKTGAVWASEVDPRATFVGRFLRKTHIDEIPQLINVLLGDMSIIGPRPERPQIVVELKQHIREYEKRLRVRPGITGLAQVWHKYDETIQDVKKKIKYDLLYIRKMCLMVDLRILLRTVFVVLTARGAR